MVDTMTITSKDNPMPSKIMNLSSLFDSPIDTITIHPEVLRVIFEINEIDNEMRDIENAAMFDFWKFEAVD
jgi:hypothetical protein